MQCPACLQNTEFKVRYVGPADYDPSGNVEDMVVLICGYCRTRLIRIQQEAVKDRSESCRREWEAMVTQLKAGTYKP
jgi:hypothetical protein